MSSSKHRAKYRLECVAASELTEYNQEWNNKIKLSCKNRYKHLFEPRLDCVGCPHLKAKKLV